MINVVEDNGETRTLMTANEGNICNRAADLLKNGFISKKAPSLNGLDGVGTAPQFLGPNLFRNAGLGRSDKEIGITATWTNSLLVKRDRGQAASRRCGRMLFLSQEIVDKLKDFFVSTSKDFFVSTSPFARVSMDELGAMRARGQIHGK